MSKKSVESERGQQQQYSEHESDQRQALLTFHQELTETCVDLMSRYSFVNCTVTQRRDKVTAFLLPQGQSSSWSLILILRHVCAALQPGPRQGIA